MNSAAPQPHDEFVAQLSTATYDHYATLPDAIVASPEAFEEMRAYLLDLHGEARVEHSYRADDGQIIDLATADSHPATRRYGGPLRITAPQPSPATAGGTLDTALARPAAPQTGAHAGVGRGADAAAADTLPMYRTTLEQLTRFTDLAAFRKKEPPPASGDAAAGPHFLPKRYATGEQEIVNAGGGSVVSVWAPSVAPVVQESYGQQWYLGGVHGTWEQTVECGWHVDVARYHDFNPHLFVYSTKFNYEENTGYFNMDGGAFVPNAGASVLPGATLQSSVIDGADNAYQMGFWLVDGAWVFYFAGEAIGGYPLSWFVFDGNDGPMTSNADVIRFGGEVGAGSIWPSMGSGRHAHEGYAKAAYHRQAFVTSLDGSAQYATLSHAGSVVGPCYSVDIHNTTDPDWATYLFYGGGGGAGC